MSLSLTVKKKIIITETKLGEGCGFWLTRPDHILRLERRINAVHSNSRFLQKPGVCGALKLE